MRTTLLALSLFLSACDCSGGEENERRTIAVIPKGTTHVFWRSVHAGALRAGNELGVEILWQGPVREDDRAAQIRVVEDMIVRDVDAIVLAPLDNRALVPVATEATREGIPVVIFDSGIEWDGYVSYVATDNRLGGQIAARRLGQLLEGRGKVILLRYLEGHASTGDREEGFLAAMREEFPNIEIVSSDQRAGATTETAYSASENLLVRFPDVNGIFTPNESATHGMMRALVDANRAGQVKLVGFDASEAIVEGLRQGHIHGLVLQDPVRMGDQAVRAAIRRLDGEHPDRRIDTGATMVTRENMEEPEIAPLLSPDLSILDD